jgi:hypothetical protein
MCRVKGTSTSYKVSTKAKAQHKTIQKHKNEIRNTQDKDNTEAA